MNVLSLFSGVGGFDLGLEQAGMKTVYQCEYDKHATKILERHWPTVPRWGDIATLTGREVLRHAPEIDVVAWGSPCQDLSVAGKRSGLDGARSGLFFHGMRIINEIREATNGRYPRISIWENVAGALNSNRGADFGRVLDAMAEAGAMVIEWRLLDAQYFGIPQRRRRVFVIAVFDSGTAERCPDPLLPISEGLRRDTAAGATARESVASEVTPRTGSGGHIEPFTGSSHAQYKEGVGTLRANGGDLAGGSETLLVEPLAKTKAEEPIVFENSRRDSARIAEDGVTQILSAHMGTGGGNTPMVALGIQGNVIGRQDHNGPAGKGFTSDGDPMFTLTSTDVHAVALPLTVRRLTPRECERLMGWPDDWTAEQADAHRYKQCGNGVASPVAKWIGEQLMVLA